MNHLVLAIGLLLFLGVHSVRIFAEDWRQQRISAWGNARWKGIFSMLSAAGLALLVWGYGMARHDPWVLWTPPVPMRHIAALLTLVAFVLLVAAYFPGNAIKDRLKHPMVLGVKTWALAHLLSNGTVADGMLFGSFLLWAVLSFRAARLRGAVPQVVSPPAWTRRTASTVLTVATGIVGWWVFAFWGHHAIIGVQPFGI